MCLFGEFYAYYICTYIKNLNNNARGKGNSQQREGRGNSQQREGRVNSQQQREGEGQLTTTRGGGLTLNNNARGRGNSQQQREGEG